MSDRCPCMRGDTYDDCCGALLNGTKSAATAEQLMRSRYTAFAVGDRDYLLRTWEHNTRPRSLDLDPDQQWFRLDILGATGGGLFDTEGTVEFRAHFRYSSRSGRRDVLHQNSRFVRQDGAWVYLD